MVLAAELVRRGAALHGPRTAVIFGDRSLTFAETDEYANRFANHLASLGIAKGDRLGLLYGNMLWSIPIDFACLKGGIVRMPLNPRLSATEQQQMMLGTGTTWLLYDEALRGVADEIAAGVPGTRALSIDELVAGAATASADEPRVPLVESDPMLMLHTSGTTGTLKAAVHTQGSYGAITANVLANLISPQPDSVMLHAASLIHASGTFILPYWIRGATSVVLSGFEPGAFLAAIEKHKVTEINLVPTMIGMLFASPEIATADVSSLRTVIYGASPMPKPLIARAMKEWGPIFKQYYGQTEIPLVITALDEKDHEDESLLGSCGRPSVDYSIRLIGEDGNPVAPGEIGEVQLTSPTQMSGYYNAPELNADSITPDGWIRTRDMAYVNERGYYFLVDRRSDMIISGGYNVYPREVEDALSEHAAVAEVAVVGAPDDTWVEAVVAFVALKPGASATEQELQDVARSRLAGYKVPKRIEFVDTLPKSAVGKILRRAVREPLWEGKR